MLPSAYEVRRGMNRIGENARRSLRGRRGRGRGEHPPCGAQPRRKEEGSGVGFYLLFKEGKEGKKPGMAEALRPSVRGGEQVVLLTAVEKERERVQGSCEHDRPRGKKKREYVLIFTTSRKSSLFSPYSCMGKRGRERR